MVSQVSLLLVPATEGFDLLDVVDFEEFVGGGVGGGGLGFEEEGDEDGPLGV